ncbi:MAG TPA: BrnA antitoxin family protein [Candidatus Solibacter sp.]|nr:BrnA antitoxin family protein [Candidatus Solibacter sp.]
MKKKLTKQRKAELSELARLPDDKIDLSDAPELPDWTHAVIGKFYRPIKCPVTVCIDADVLAWLKRAGPGYQTRINSLLRQAMRPPHHPKPKKPRA